MSAFDAVVGFILASALARAVNGSAPFFSTLLAGFLLVLLHRLLGIVAYHWHWFGKLVKGEAQVLVRGGKLNRKTLRDHKISDADLLEESRLNGQVNELDQIQTATFERNGKISVIPAKEKSG